MFAAGAFKGCVNYLVPLVGSLVLQNIFVVPIEMTSGRGINSVAVNSEVRCKSDKMKNRVPE